MKRLKQLKTAITVDSMALYCKSEEEQLVAFCKRHKIVLPTYEQLHDILYEPGYDTSDKLFEEAKLEITNRAFVRFVEDMIDEVKYYNSYAATHSNYKNIILGKARAIWKVHNLLYNKDVKRDQLAEAQSLINLKNEYISTSSQVLNTYIGGFTRKYVASVIAKSSHAKSSWLDYNSAHSIVNNKVKRIVKITPEEDAGTQYRRYLALFCKISTTAMRMKTVEITDAHIQLVKDKLQNRLMIYDTVYKYKDVIDLLSSINDTDMIIIDHLQAIEYPGNGTFLNNMIGNIPGLINFQKKIAKNINCSIINVSQVADKEIARSDRIIKAPRFYDAYGSSVLYQVSREFLALWYPYRDWEDQLINPGTVPSENEIQISIEKSSFSRVGKVMLHFNPEFNLFTDMSKKQLGKLDYVAPIEQTLFEE